MNRVAVMVLTGATVVPALANASTVTFDWVQSGGTGTASGEMTISSAAITAAQAAGTAAFTIPAGSFPTGETAVGDWTSFSFSLGGQTMAETLSNVSLSNSTGWKDALVGSNYVLESTWSASHTFTTPFPGGTLLDVGNSTSGSTASYPGVSATGSWVLRPTAVPVPASAWLMLSGTAGLGLLSRRRKSLAV